MMQDQYGQPQSAGYVVRGEVVQDDESGVPPTGQAPPMTHFQKVASALRGDQPGQPASQDPDEAGAEEVQAVSSPDSGPGDYWDDDEAEAEPAEDLEAGSADDLEAASVQDAAASDPPAADQEASAPAGQAEEDGGPADPADPDAHEATDRSVTPQPNVFGAPRAAAATADTVPIALATEEPAGNGGKHAAPEAELRPGDSGTTLGLGQSGYASLLPDTEDLRAQWHRIQYRFVDDPRVSVTEAADVIAQVATRLEAAIAERQRDLRGRWDTGAPADTETLRETLRMYRSFLDQLIGPEPS